MIGIWGSCVSRDTFEFAGVANDELTYHARSSWISQAAPTVPTELDAPNGTGFGHRMVREDMTKAIVSALAEASPSMVVIDLIDERFDVVELSGSRYSVNDYYERLEMDAAFRDTATDTIPFVDERRVDLFDQAAGQLAPRLIEVLPDTTFVLHQAWYTARTADPEQPFYASAPTAVVVRNERLAAQYESLLRAFSGRLHVVEADRRTCLIGDPGHKWGLAH